MPGFTRIVNYDPLPNVGYGKAEVKDEPLEGQAHTDVVVITNAPQGGSQLNVGDKFTILTPVGTPVVQVGWNVFTLIIASWNTCAEIERGPTVVGVR